MSSICLYNGHVDMPGARLSCLHVGDVPLEVPQVFPPLAWLSHRSRIILASPMYQVSQSFSNVSGPQVWATDLRPS